MAVERAMIVLHERFNLKTTGYDPYQAALMAQRLELQRVRMKEVPFTGKNLDHMANTMLDVFRSRRIELFNCERLIADLRRLQIEEKSYGYRLSATRDEAGHADTATAFAIALPIAVSILGQVPAYVGAFSGEPTTDKHLTPFMRELKRLSDSPRNSSLDRGYTGSTDHQEPIREVLTTLRQSFFS
ncbi:MAG TPA: hypothetical protein PLY87_10380 [Planctomycetaceae bacterium]|nr:hypothetical protein [Planctomycetaceae bacterium]